MNLLHLEYFYVVAREGGYTKASQVLRVQQPAISRLVAQLEDQLGFRLFEKVGRHVRLTTQGQGVYEQSRRIFAEVDALKVSVGEVSNVCKGSLIFGAADVIASEMMPKNIAGYLKKHPAVYPQMISGPASFLTEKLAGGDMEFGLFFHLPNLPEGLEVFRRLPVPYRLVVRKDLLKDKNVVQSFIGSREIDDTTTRKFPTIERMKRKYPATKIKISSNNLVAHREMVRKGLGVSILPEFLVQQDISAGRFVDVLPNEEFEFELKFVKRKTGVLSLNARELLKEIS